LGLQVVGLGILGECEGDRTNPGGVEPGDVSLKGIKVRQQAVAQIDGLDDGIVERRARFAEAPGLARGVSILSRYYLSVDLKPTPTPASVAGLVAGGVTARLGRRHLDNRFSESKTVNHILGAPLPPRISTLRET
jgi:hypothetical protein